MTAFALVLALAAALDFDASEVPRHLVTGVQALSGAPDTGYTHADLDGDGVVDLLFDDQVWFQRAGRFPAGAGHDLPGMPGDAWMQALEGDLHTWDGEHLGHWRWEGAWRAVAEWDLARPEDAVRPRWSRAVLVCRTPFLHDFDGDGVPELFAATPRGVLTWTRAGDGYAGPRTWEVLPPMSLAYRGPRPLWPPETRRIDFPVFERVARLALEGDTVSVLRRLLKHEGGGYERRRYHWHGETAELVEVNRTQPAPTYLNPCRLNRDEVIDLAGGRWETSRTTALPLPVYETWASLDGGATFAVRRTTALPGFRPRCSFIDFNGDGLLDLVTEETGLFDGGVRETLARVLTLPEVRHEVAVYFQREGSFEKLPGYRAALEIDLGTPPVRQDEMFQHYQAGELVDVTGDFDGDGWRDVAVRDRVDNLTIHLTRPGARPAHGAELALPAAVRFHVADINGDGRSDVVAQGPEGAATVYFCTGEKP